MSLDHVDEITHEPRLLFTEPWDPIVVRRGDALGLLALNNMFAETVAPGLSNRVRDGRWVTILRGVLCDRTKSSTQAQADPYPRGPSRAGGTHGCGRSNSCGCQNHCSGPT